MSLLALSLSSACVYVYYMIRRRSVHIYLSTTDSYTLFNGPMRKGVKPHPLRTTMYILDEALDKMKKVVCVCVCVCV